MWIFFETRRSTCIHKTLANNLGYARRKSKSKTLSANKYVNFVDEHKLGGGVDDDKNLKKNNQDSSSNNSVDNNDSIQYLLPKSMRPYIWNLRQLSTFYEFQYVIATTNYS